MAKQNYNKLELTWIGKGEEPKLEPRILIENPEYSYGDPKSENMLIHGDNLLALKALEQDFTGKIKCIYIDPPYNTGNAFEHYDDGIEHSLWLTLMHSRLRILKNLLSDDGFICVQIDDNESAYLKVMMDEIFGRVNYVNTFYIQVRYGNKTLAEDNDYQKVIEQIHIYSKNIKNAKANKKTEPYRVDKFEWDIEELSPGEIIELGGKKVEIFKDGTYSINKIEPTLNALKETWATGSLVRQTGSSGEFLDKYLAPRKNIDGLSTLYKVYGIGEDGLGYRYMTGPKKQDATKGKFFSGIPLKTLEDIKNGNSDKSKPIENFYDLAGNFGNCRHEGGVSFGGGKKPEALMQIILEYFSSPDDLILDSFGGSGSTAASAHKLDRKWITIELGEQAYTHIQPRLMSVITGSDQTGISSVTNWKGGGGFKFYNLAPSLLNEDKYGNWIISKEYNAQMLASAVAKQEGFKYEPDEHVYWKQGVSSEKDFIFTTTQFITAELMDKIHEEMQSGESLLIACKSYQEGCENRHANISIKKIPHMLMGRCEYGKDDYSFNIVNMPVDENAEPWETPEEAYIKPLKKTSKPESQPGLFDNE
jgi:adenine-specific DNA-methyltransferase